MYCSCLTDPDDKQDALMHAMQHCNVFKKMYLEADTSFIKAWTGQFDENGVMIPSTKQPRNTPQRRVKGVSDANNVVSKLSGKYGDAEIMDLLKLLGL